MIYPKNRLENSSFDSCKPTLSCFRGPTVLWIERLSDELLLRRCRSTPTTSPVTEEYDQDDAEDVRSVWVPLQIGIIWDNDDDPNNHPNKFRVNLFSNKPILGAILLV